MGRSRRPLAFTHDLIVPVLDTNCPLAGSRPGARGQATLSADYLVALRRSCPMVSQGADGTLLVCSFFHENTKALRLHLDALVETRELGVFDCFASATTQKPHHVHMPMPNSSPLPFKYTWQFSG